MRLLLGSIDRCRVAGRQLIRREMVTVLIGVGTAENERKLQVPDGAKSYLFFLFFLFRMCVGCARFLYKGFVVNPPKGRCTLIVALLANLGGQLN